MTRLAIDPDDLLAGPRGRRVCWSLLEGASGRRRLADATDVEVVTYALARADIRAIADADGPTAFLDALEEAVCAARYWQEPDDDDLWLAAREIGALLRPVVEAVSATAAARWWAAPIDLMAQHEVEFDDPDGGDPVPRIVDPHAALIDWRADTLSGESDATSLPADPTAPYTGHWWSTPAWPGIMCSTRALDGHGPVGLTLVEDGFGWTSAHSRALRVRPGASVFEISGPEAWVELVERYPLTVTNSRRHDWWRVTGQNVAWAIPDYLAAAADFDGIHLTVLGYLSTAGRALPAADAYTVLAGWNPDETWWLTDSAELTGSPMGWSREDLGDAIRWLRATA